MLEIVPLQTKKLEDYRPIIGDEALDAILSAAAPFKGARLLHINATAFGGGVAEILHTLVPLMRDVGIDAEWQVIRGDDEFFNVTKAFHNALQGADIILTDEMRAIFNKYNQENAAALEGEYDYIIVHDPQPAALRYFHGPAGGKHWVSRIHIDTSNPNPAVWEFLQPYLSLYEAGIFTMAEYVYGDLKFPHLAIIAPSIDPLSPKNTPLPEAESKAILQRYGIDLDRPLITQVSRFDPWKDPLGVIDAYRMVKVEMPEVQLALVGSMASDDPEGWIYYDKTIRHAGDDFDIHILHNFHGVGNVEVNAFQTISDVVVQKSTREGFGLVVTEPMWKGRPVIGGNVGGIPLQVIDGQTGYLVNNILECAVKMHAFLKDPTLADEMGARAREHVRQNFLSTRHLQDYLRLMGDLRA
jgi:trehalose synthase